MRFWTDCATSEVQGLLGAGGMGEEYAALAPRTAPKRRGKVLPVGATANTTAVARVQREAHAVAALNHSNISSTFDTGEHEGSPFLVIDILTRHSHADIRELRAVRKW